MSENKQLSAKPYIGYFFAIGLVSLGMSLVGGAYNSFFPIILQSGNENFAQGANSGIMGFGLNAFGTSIIMSIDNFFAFAMALVVGAWGDRTTKRRGYGIVLGLVGAIAFAFLPIVISTNKTAQSGDTRTLMPRLVITIIIAIIFVFTHNGASQLRLGYSYNIIPKPNHSLLNSFLMVFEGAGSVLFIVLGSVLYAMNSNFPFFIGAVLTGVTLLIFALVSKPETKKNAALELERQTEGKINYNPFKQIADTFRKIPSSARKNIILVICIISLTAMGVYALETFATSYMLDVLGIAPNLSIIVTGAYYIGYLAFAIPIGALAKKISSKKILLIGIIGMGTGALLTLLFGKTLITLSIFCFIMGASQSAVNVVAIPYIMSFAPDDGENTGTLISTVATLRFLVSTLTVPVVGALIDISGNYSSIFVTMAVTCAIALIPLFALMRHTEN